MVISTSLIAILVFTAAMQGWFIKKLKWFEIIAFLLISMSLFRPGFILDKVYPKFNYTDLNVQKIEKQVLEFDREVHIKVTRRTEYGDRYRLFVINRNSLEENYFLKEYGIDLIDDEGRITVDMLKWNGLARKGGFETGDVITEFKVENLDRPNKSIIYPFSLMLLFIFGYLNYRRKE